MWFEIYPLTRKVEIKARKLGWRRLLLLYSDAQILGRLQGERVVGRVGLWPLILLSVEELVPPDDVLSRVEIILLYIIGVI